MTGYFRDGFCNTCPSDVGSHTVCAQVTEDFLEYTKSQGNDLSTPMPAYGFPGLKPGDGWCLCASRWLEAQREGHAPYVKLESTHANALDTIPLEILKQYGAPEVEHDDPAGPAAPAATEPAAGGNQQA